MTIFQEKDILGFIHQNRKGDITDFYFPTQHNPVAAEESGRRVNFDFPPINKEKAYDIIEVMQLIATQKGVTVAQIALAWLLHQPVVTSIIVGAKKQEQLLDNLKAIEINLTVDELSKLNEVSNLTPEYPGWMIERQGSDRR